MKTITARQITPEYEATFKARLYVWRGWRFQLLCDRCLRGMLGAGLVSPPRRLPLKIDGRCAFAGWDHE